MCLWCTHSFDLYTVTVMQFFTVLYICLIASVLFIYLFINRLIN